jgi:quercetin dioxygenase-like cupin family protein
MATENNIMTESTHLAESIHSPEDYASLRKSWRSTAACPKFVRREESEIIDAKAAGQQIAVLLSGADTAGESAVFEVICEAGGGAPPHFQVRESEYFYVVEGEFEIQAGDEVQTVRAGGLVFAPRQTVHAFRNIGSTTGKFLSWNSPGGHELFFKAVTQKVEAGAEPDAIAARAEHFDTKFDLGAVAVT